jgi:hypothetical protein
VRYAGEEHPVLSSARTIHAALAALLVCLALGVAACGGDGGSGSSPQPERQPLAVTGAAGNIDENDAEISATINPNDVPSVTYYFEYGTSTQYGEQTPSKPVSGNKNKAVTADLSDLDPDTEYHYRVVLKTGSGTFIRGGDQTFTTPAAGEGGGGGGNGGNGGDNATTGGTTTGGGTTGTTTGGYTTTPPPSTGGYTTTPPPSTGGLTTTPPPSTGGYTTTPPPTTGGN